MTQDRVGETGKVRILRDIQFIVENEIESIGLKAVRGETRKKKKIIISGGYS